MREIKFRTWDKEYKKIKYSCNPVCHGDLNILNFSWLEEDYVIMQYTGLKDRNKCDIYEGDIILNYNYDTKGEVRWVDGNAEYICYHASGWFKFTDEYEVELIGNIYENPELMKVK